MSQTNDGGSERFDVRAELRSDPRFVRHEAFDRQLECAVMLERPGQALLREVETAHGERVLREAKMLARITHPNVVRLREVTRIDGVPTLVLDLPAGESLADELQRVGNLPPERLAQLGRDLAQAAQAAHGEGVVHRGIAAENVFLEPASGRAMLAGFTFAKLLEKRMGHTSLDHRQRKDSGAAAAGLPTYPAPEQLAGRGADHRADVFALGCLLYRAATGREAFADDAVEFATPPPVHRVAPGVPRALSAVIGQCIAHAPSQRYQNMLQVDEALAAAQLRQGASRRGWITGVSVGAAVVLAAFIVPDVVRSMTAPGDVRGIDPPPETRREYGYQVGFAKSRALVIGTNYGDNAAGIAVLGNAESDALAVAARMTELGWDVKPLIGAMATRDKILEELRVIDEGAPDERALIYFAGHGELHPNGDKTLYLLPHDAGPARLRPGGQPADVMRNWLERDRLLPVVRSGRPKHILLALDCCHAGAITRQAFGLDSEDDEPKNYGTAVAMTLPARWVLTSARSVEQASDGDGSARSPFAAGFLAGLAQVTDDRSSDVYTLLRSVRERIDADGARQVARLECFATDEFAEFVISPAR